VSMQRVFITGVASGLGLALAQRFLAAGDTVGGCDLGSAPAGLPVGIDYRSADVCDAEAMTHAIRDFADRHGGLDVVVANAGINMPKARVPDFGLARRVIEVNVIGVLNTLAPAIAIMQSRGQGRLVVPGSIAGLNGLPGVAGYGASKAAVMNLCESLAVDLREDGIAVTMVAPGFIDTPLVRENRHPMPFLMSPEAAAARIHRAIRRGRTRDVFPWPLALLSAVLQRLPRSWYRWIARVSPLRFR